ncbi:hypothetical protein ACFXI3_39900 [Amycolatopsis sp. NPDC059235]|uniref:hypothetical protein n=1 Tax=Amycolatopsis sp. NPDC059235 TaxID=3346782 RepID=UPI00366AADF5
MFLGNPLFTVLALPFGTGRTSPIAAAPYRLGVRTHRPGSANRRGDRRSNSRALARAVQVSEGEWNDQLARSGLTPHVRQHIATMAALHRADRQNRSTPVVEKITGRKARSVEQYVRERRPVERDEDSEDPSLNGSAIRGPINCSSRRNGTGLPRVVRSRGPARRGAVAGFRHLAHRSLPVVG